MEMDTDGAAEVVVAMTEQGRWGWAQNCRVGELWKVEVELGALWATVEGQAEQLGLLPGHWGGEGSTLGAERLLWGLMGDGQRPGEMGVGAPEERRGSEQGPGRKWGRGSQGLGGGGQDRLEGVTGGEAGSGLQTGTHFPPPSLCPVPVSGSLSLGAVLRQKSSLIEYLLHCWGCVQTINTEITNSVCPRALWKGRQEGGGSKGPGHCCSDALRR